MSPTTLVTHEERKFACRGSKKGRYIIKISSRWGKKVSSKRNNMDTNFKYCSILELSRAPTTYTRLERLQTSLNPPPSPTPKGIRYAHQPGAFFTLQYSTNNFFQGFFLEILGSTGFPTQVTCARALRSECFCRPSHSKVACPLLQYGIK